MSTSGRRRAPGSYAMKAGGTPGVRGAVMASLLVSGLIALANAPARAAASSDTSAAGELKRLSVEDLMNVEVTSV